MKKELPEGVTFSNIKKAMRFYAFTEIILVIVMIAFFVMGMTFISATAGVLFFTTEYCYRKTNKVYEEFYGNRYGLIDDARGSFN